MPKKPAANAGKTKDVPHNGRRITRPGPGETWAEYEPKSAPRPKVEIRYHAPANDNRRPEGVVVPLSEHREERRQAEGESTPDRVRNNLRRTAPAAYRTLCRVAELLRPADLNVIEFPVAANDNNTGVAVERRHEVTPGNEQDLIEAMADGLRPRVVVRRDPRTKGYQEETLDRYPGGFSFSLDRDDHETIEIGGRSSVGRFYGLQTYRGEIIAFAREGRKARQAYEIGEQRGPDGDPWLPRGSTASAAAPEALAEIDRVTATDHFSQQLDAETRRLLQVVVDADSFAEIGRAAGYAESAAHKHGKRMAVDTLNKIQEKLAA